MNTRHHSQPEAPARSRNPAEPTTTGRPKESGSRQQTHPGQSSQTGSTDLDEDFAGQAPSDPGVLKPAGAK